MKTKKKSIKALIDSLNRKDWDYYISKKVCLPSFDNKPDNRCDGHLKFIKKMFEISEKKGLIEDDLCRYEVYLTPNHVSSVFLLGIIVNKHLDLIKVTPPELSDERKSDEDENKILDWIDLSEIYESNLLFVWFLSVLYHDIAKHIEQSGKENAAISNLEDLYERFQIEHKLLDKEDTTPCTHLTSIRKEYFKFMRVRCGKVEHGILAGIVLYDWLVKVRIANQNNKETKLKWDEGVEKLYKLASDAVSIHNIWPETASEIPGFDKNAAPIKVNDYPLFYLLAVVDSIEPLRKFRRDYKKDNSKAGDLQKKWDKMTDEQILSEIYLQFDKKKKSMTISTEKESDLDLSCMVKENTFEKWLDVDFTKNQDGSVTLTFR